MVIPRIPEVLRRWLLAIACFGLLIFFFSPSWGAFELWSRVPEMQGMLEVRRGASVLEQVASPGAEISDPLHRAIQWRLLFPVIGRVLHLPPTALFGLAHAGCLLVLAYLVALLRRHHMEWLDTGFAVAALGAATWFFTSTGWLGYYDSWLVLALLFVAFGKTAWVVWLACLWAPWVDERFIIAAPLALLCRYAAADVHVTRSYERERVDAPSLEAPLAHVRSYSAPGGLPALWTNPTRRRELGIAAGLLAAFLIVRLGVLAGRSAEGATLGSYLSGRNFLDAPLSRIALGVWEGLRAGWVFVFAAVVLAARVKPWAIAIASASVVTAAVGLATAQDYGRSTSMLLPVAVLGAVLAARARPSWLRGGLRASAVIALLLPAHHVMDDRVNPIFYLYHELAALKHPPPSAMPELYELRAIHQMERGEFAAAERDLDLAIRLAREPVSASKQRGILRASQGRWAEAHEDFSTMVEHAPDHPDAWFMRAQAGLALGDHASARSDFKHALTLAPEGWTDRPDVNRFITKLNQASR